MLGKRNPLPLRSRKVSTKKVSLQNISNCTCVIIQIALGSSYMHNCKYQQKFNVRVERWYSSHCLLSWLVAVNKMVCHFWHQFLTQFLLLFQMVPFFFLSMAALRTTNTKLSDWLLELFQPIRLWLSELPYRAKWMVPSERALKTKSETGVKSFTPFCRGSSH